MTSLDTWPAVELFPDHVDVILSHRDRLAEKSAGVEIHTSEVILSNVRVLAIDQTVEEKNGLRVVVGKTATLELAPRQAETLAVSPLHRERSSFGRKHSSSTVIPPCRTLSSLG